MDTFVCTNEVDNDMLWLPTFLLYNNAHISTLLNFRLIFISHIVGDKLTIADIMILSTSVTLVGGIFDGVPPTMFDPFENIQAVRKNVANHAKVASYLESMKDEKMYGPFAKLLGQ